MMIALALMVANMLRMMDDNGWWMINGVRWMKMMMMVLLM
jgi:hypothetical protein